MSKEKNMLTKIIEEGLKEAKKGIIHRITLKNGLTLKTRRSGNMYIIQASRPNVTPSTAELNTIGYSIVQAGEPEEESQATHPPLIYWDSFPTKNSTGYSVHIYAMWQPATLYNPTLHN